MGSRSVAALSLPGVLFEDLFLVSLHDLIVPSSCPAMANDAWKRQHEMLQLQERLEGHKRSKGEGVRVGRNSFMFGLGESFAFAESTSA